MLPDVFDFDEVIEEIEEDREIGIFNGFSYLYDFNKGDFVYQNGNPVRVSGTKAIEVWIEKILRTRINTYEIYKYYYETDEENFGRREYGSDAWNLVRGKKLPQVFFRAEIIRDIEEALDKNPYIKRVENFFIGHVEGDKGYQIRVEFDVVLYTDEEMRMEVDL